MNRMPRTNQQTIVSLLPPVKAAEPIQLLDLLVNWTPPHGQCILINMEEFTTTIQCKLFGTCGSIFA